MKKLYTFLIIALIGFLGNAQIVNIPDANFKAKLLGSTPTNNTATNLVGSNFKIDENSDGEIQVSEALQVRSLQVENSSIVSLEGIQNFTNLTLLDCAQNQITTFNYTALINLQGLLCAYNSIQSLDMTGFSNLEVLMCANNVLTTINITSLSNFSELYCQNNLLQTIDLTGLPNLKKLECCCNQITALDLSNKIHLEILSCFNNQISTLTLNNNPALLELTCYNNQIYDLNVSGLSSIQNLSCSNNHISTLAVNSLTTLLQLDCGNNELTTLDVSSSGNINSLYCSYNQLTSLVLGHAYPTIFNFNCSHNQLSTLDVSQIKYFTNLLCQNNQLTSIIFSNQSISFDQLMDVSDNLFTTLVLPISPLLPYFYCNNNPNLTSLFIKNVRFDQNGIFYSEAGFTLTNCPNLNYICTIPSYVSQIQTKVNNLGYTCTVNPYCSYNPGGIVYVVTGHNRYDSNTNGCDSADINIPNLRLSYTGSSGNVSGDASGVYYLPFNSGSHIITPILECPTYFTVSPSSASVNFPTTSSPYTQNFCITANGLHNDLEVNLLPIGRARPGEDVQYKILYKNNGTNTQSGALSLSFNDAILDLVSATPSITSSSTNNLNWDFSNLLAFESREITLTLNINSPLEVPSVNGGDILQYISTVVGATDETPSNNTSTLNQTVVNSYDPNDKTSMEGTTISPAMVGQYVHYIIRFENDGTANAQNIVVKDMIDTSKFDVSSLISLSGSAAYTTRITNTNQVEFIFQNINLPFAAGTNTGYVAFKIKTKSTLVVGNTFSNSASIYFDYNAPIVTNTATTTIATLGNQDFDFGTVFTLSPVPAKNSLTITAKQAVIMSSVNIYNTLGQLVQVNTNPNEAIDVSGLQSGSYFIRITTDKGTATGKFIKE